MTYEEFELLFDCWQGFQRAVNSLEEPHPMKQFHDNVFKQLRTMPDEDFEDFLIKYSDKRLKSDLIKKTR